MITALVRVEGGVEALAVTLSALVSAVAEGLVADAVVLTAREDPAIARVADALGAGIVVLERDHDPWAAGARLAKRDWVLCLDAGDVPSGGWIRAVEHFLALSPPERRLGRFPRRAGSLREALLWRWRSLAGPRVQAGDVVRREVLLAGAKPGRPARIPAAIERDPVFG
jgi:hypothetical protein